MVNAFTIRGPVDPQNFFDRRDIVDFFCRLVRNESDILIAVMAPFKFGKSSLLLKFKEIASKSEWLYPIYIKLTTVANPIRAILNELPSYLPIKQALEILAKEKEIYRAFVIISRELEKRKKHLLLLIDEFQLLAKLIKSEGYLRDMDDKYIFEYFRGLTEDLNINLVVSGSFIGNLLDSIDVWHGRFTIFRLREFPLDDSILMLKTLFKRSGFDINDDVAEYIAVAMNEHPFHMQLFGYHLVNMGRIDEETIENTRKKVQRELIDYYATKLIEAKNIDANALKVLSDLIGRRISLKELMAKNFLETAIKLERGGFLYRDNADYEIWDKMFERFLSNTLTNREPERYIPEYTSEYIVANELAHKYNFKKILVSYMSWGSLDIVVLSKIGKYNGLGIQVKRTYTETIPNIDVEKIESDSKQIGVIPILAIVKMPEKRVKYCHPTIDVCSYNLSEIIKLYYKDE